MAEDITHSKREKPQCLGDGCSKPSFARGYCKTHYSRWRLHRDPNKTLTPLRLPAVCEAPGCERKPHTRWQKGMAVCNLHWQMLYRYGHLEAPPTAPPDPLPLCSVHKCKNEARSRNAGLCEKHYGRMRRGVALDKDRPVLGRYMTSAGYMKVLKPDHPLADRNGTVFEHRLVVYEQRRGEEPSCFWCDKALTWPETVIDHLNEIKDDNRPENLVPACNDCNRARGAMVPFLLRMKCEAVAPFIETIKTIRGELDISYDRTWMAD